MATDAAGFLYAAAAPLATAVAFLAAAAFALGWLWRWFRRVIP